MVYHKGKGVMFGGVSDLKQDEETIESKCHDDLFQLQIEQNKWYSLVLKDEKVATGKMDYTQIIKQATKRVAMP